MRSRRNRLVSLLALASLGAAVPLCIPGTAAAAVVGDCDTGPQFFAWNGTPDGSWSDPANWEGGSPGHDLPGPADSVCVDSTVTGSTAVPAGTVLRTLAIRGPRTAPMVSVDQDVVIDEAVYVEGHLRFLGSARVGDGLGRGQVSYTGLVELAATASVRVESSVSAQYAQPAPTLEVAGELRYRALVTDELVVRAGGRVLPGPEVGGARFGGRTDLQLGSRLDVVGGSVTFTPESKLVRGRPNLVDVSILATGPDAVTARGDVRIDRVAAGSTLTVVAQDDRLSVGPLAGAPRIVNQGSLTVTGPTLEPDGPSVGIVGEVLDNQGSLALARVRLETLLINQGTAQLDQVVAVGPDPDPTGSGSLFNVGRIHLGEASPVLPGRASLLVTGRVRNHGVIDGGGAARLVAMGADIEEAGTIDASLVLEDGTFDVPRSIPQTPEFHVSSLDWDGERFRFDLDSFLAYETDRLVIDGTAGSRVGLTGATVPSVFDVSLPDGVVCGGSRWSLVHWAQGSARPAAGPGTLVATGLPSGVVASIEERADGLVLVTSGAPTSGAACTESTNRRFVNGLFVEGLGQGMVSSDLAYYASRSTSRAGRRKVAGELLGGPVALDRTVADEMLRILGRPASAAGAAAGAARVRSGAALDDVRAEVYGGSAFWVASGRSDDRWVEAFYRTELGRQITASERSTVYQFQARRVSRRSIARLLLAGSEADRALAGRTIEQWWARPATTAERATWGARYQAGQERSVTLDLVAAVPLQR